jgi:hypothetical protein
MDFEFGAAEVCTIYLHCAGCYYQRLFLVIWQNVQLQSEPVFRVKHMILVEEQDWLTATDNDIPCFILYIHGCNNQCL